MQSQILPSRAALVDRIAMQFEYGQNLIALVGPSGLGKSYLAETLITEKYPEFNKAYIQVTAQMKDTELMTQLLQNSFRAPLVDQTQTLSDNFFQLYQTQPHFRFYSQTKKGPYCLPKKSRLRRRSQPT